LPVDRHESGRQGRHDELDGRRYRHDPGVVASGAPGLAEHQGEQGFSEQQHGQEKGDGQQAQPQRGAADFRHDRSRVVVGVHRDPLEVDLADRRRHNAGGPGQDPERQAVEARHSTGEEMAEEQRGSLQHPGIEQAGRHGDQRVFAIRHGQAPCIPGRRRARERPQAAAYARHGHQHVAQRGSPYQAVRAGHYQGAEHACGGDDGALHDPQPADKTVALVPVQPLAAAVENGKAENRQGHQVREGTGGKAPRELHVQQIGQAVQEGKQCQPDKRRHGDAQAPQPGSIPVIGRLHNGHVVAAGGAGRAYRYGCRKQGIHAKIRRTEKAGQYGADEDGQELRHGGAADQREDIAGISMRHGRPAGSNPEQESTDGSARAIMSRIRIMPCRNMLGEH